MDGYFEELFIVYFQTSSTNLNNLLYLFIYFIISGEENIG